MFTSPAIWNSKQSPSYTISCLVLTPLQNLAINVQLETYLFACVDRLGCFQYQVAIPCQQQRLHKHIYQGKKPFPSDPSSTLCQTWAIRPLELLQILDRNSQHHLPVTNFEPTLIFLRESDYGFYCAVFLILLLLTDNRNNIAMPGYVMEEDNTKKNNRLSSFPVPIFRISFLERSFCLKAAFVAFSGNVWPSSKGQSTQHEALWEGEEWNGAGIPVS